MFKYVDENVYLIESHPDMKCKVSPVKGKCQQNKSKHLECPSDCIEKCSNNSIRKMLPTNDSRFEIIKVSLIKDMSFFI